MPIALIELQKRIESLPGVHARQKDQTTSIAQTEKMIVTRSKSESPRESRLSDGRERNDRPWIPKILVSAAIEQRMEDIKNITVF